MQIGATFLEDAYKQYLVKCEYTCIDFVILFLEIYQIDILRTVKILHLL